MPLYGSIVSLKDYVTSCCIGARMRILVFISTITYPKIERKKFSKKKSNVFISDRTFLFPVLLFHSAMANNAVVPNSVEWLQIVHRNEANLGTK